MRTSRGLDPLQRRLLELIREQVPEADGFALAGGGALILHGVVDRPTRDLDLFSTEARDVPLAAAALTEAAQAEGLRVETVRSGASFRRLMVTDPPTGSATLVDLAWDARIDDVVASGLGPLLSIAELAADKALALFGRAEARDLLDLRALVQRLGPEMVLEAAASKDGGFDRYVFAQMLARTDDIPDTDFPVDGEELAELRAWAARWRRELAEGLLD